MLSQFGSNGTIENVKKVLNILKHAWETTNNLEPYK
jgi:hypothetical protein